MSICKLIQKINYKSNELPFFSPLWRLQLASNTHVLRRWAVGMLIDGVADITSVITVFRWKSQDKRFDLDEGRSRYPCLTEPVPRKKKRDSKQVLISTAGTRPLWQCHECQLSFMPLRGGSVDVINDIFRHGIPAQLSAFCQRLTDDHKWESRKYSPISNDRPSRYSPPQTLVVFSGAR